MEGGKVEYLNFGRLKSAPFALILETFLDALEHILDEVSVIHSEELDEFGGSSST